MAEFINLTSEGDGKQFGESIIRTETNQANSTPARNFGQQLLGTNASSALSPLPTQGWQCISPFSNHPFREYANIVKPIDWSKVKKIRKWEYDPNTIARDVLLATDSHPDRPGLNYHLQPLLSNFTYVNADSDLAKFRWDLVDPGKLGTVARPISTDLITMPPTAEGQSHAAQNVPVRSPLKPTRGGIFSGDYRAAGRPSSTLPITHRGVHLSTSSFFRRSFDPTPRHDGGLTGVWGLSHQQVDSRPQTQRTMMSSSLAPTPHWNIPSTPFHGATSSGRLGMDGQSTNSLYHNLGPPQYTSSPGPPRKSSLSVTMEPATPLSFLGQNAMSGTAVRGLDESRYGFDAPSPASPSTPQRGRPPTAGVAIEIPSLNPKKRGRPFKNSEEISAPNPNPKKRGRPFKSVESAAKAAAAASDSADSMPKKRGRPFKVRTQLDIPVPEPVYIPFICEWKGCPAELHNLETLEAHVFNVHNKKQHSGTRLCLWGKCGMKHELEDNNSSTTHTQPNEFKTRKEWKDHINERHLIPFAWHMGDGPRGTCLSVKPISDSPPWLKDKDGRQVTPSVKDQPIEEGRARDNNARRFVRKIDGIHYIYERIKSPEAYRKAQNPPSDSTSDGDDEDDTLMDESS